MYTENLLIIKKISSTEFCCLNFVLFVTKLAMFLDGSTPNNWFTDDSLFVLVMHIYEQKRWCRELL